MQIISFIASLSNNFPVFSCKLTNKRTAPSDGSGMEKVGFGRVRVYLNFQMLGSGMSGIEKVGFRRLRVYPNFQMSGSGGEAP